MLESSEKFRLVAASPAVEIHRNRCIKCRHCLPVAALLFILTIAVVTLAFTVFKIKGPIIHVEKMTFDNIALNNDNVSLNVVVSMKNPNFASFRYENLTTTLFYRGAVIGDLRGPSGKAKARRTIRINVTVDIMKDRVLTRPDLVADIYSGLVNVSTYTRIWGRMKLFIFEKHMGVKVKCNVSFNVTSRAIQRHKCKRKIIF